MKVERTKATKEQLQTQEEESEIYLEANQAREKERIILWIFMSSVFALSTLIAYSWIDDHLVMYQHPGSVTLHILIPFALTIWFNSKTDKSYLIYRKASEEYKRIDATDNLRDFDWLLGENMQYTDGVAEKFLRQIDERGYLSLASYHRWMASKSRLTNEIEIRKNAKTQRLKLNEKFPDLIPGPGSN